MILEKCDCWQAYFHPDRMIHRGLSMTSTLTCIIKSSYWPSVQRNMHPSLILSWHILFIFSNYTDASSQNRMFHNMYWGVESLFWRWTLADFHDVQIHSFGTTQQISQTDEKLPWGSKLRSITATEIHTRGLKGNFASNFCVSPKLNQHVQSGRSLSRSCGNRLKTPLCYSLCSEVQLQSPLPWHKNCNKIMLWSWSNTTCIV